ncbi:MAG: hypothetical protein PHE99_02255 [Bacteroidales bacterium]|nr:hypothetical protein [Bacteroidales bacterium]MDD4656208.1 hypothetical protein [Bacteroidales bacterium]
MVTNEIQTDKVIEMFCSLMEKKIFLTRGITPKILAEFCSCKPVYLKKVLFEQFGFSIGQIITLYKVGYARELLSIGVGYEFACKYSGFNSIKELEKALECVDN